jgi:hypothetical protein
VEHTELIAQINARAERRRAAQMKKKD